MSAEVDALDLAVALYVGDEPAAAAILARSQPGDLINALATELLMLAEQFSRYTGGDGDPVPLLHDAATQLEALAVLEMADR